MNISTTAINTLAALIIKNIMCQQAIQSFTVSGNGQSVTTLSNTSVLILNTTANRTTFTVTFPPNPTDGQLFTIAMGAANAGNFTVGISAFSGGTGGDTVINALTSIGETTNPAFGFATGGSSITYIYLATEGITSNAWYRYARG